ncbi:hypothetical protein Mgra_00005635 [Meloidogyne graminicola]|uniref:DUF3752 domain-containing protein n=1 Tax=Meloidogyne graminicola TaxID=189291 RepID=A0A8S9ZNA0_9BILA|nr:hypothetical protein Mgra_00005635 [Meloidogyne graminicola]
MSSNQPPPHKNDSNQVPSWDEFNMMAHEDEVNLNENGLLLDGPVDEGNEEAEVVEPGQPEEYGPSIPPGFGDDSQDGHSLFAEHEIINNDFSAPFGANDLDLDDPEDPLQCSSNCVNLNNSRNVSRPFGPSIPSSMLPRIPFSSRGDEHFLPSIGNYSNSSSSDFIPFCDQPSSSNSTNNQVIGPTLPPDLNLPSNGQAGFPSINELDDLGGPTLPPDEPQICTSQSNIYNTFRTCRKQRNSFGPTLPCSSDEDEEEVEEGKGNALEEGNSAQIVLDENRDEGRDFEVEQSNGNDVDQFIGPVPPVPGRSDEEHFEYLARLAEFEANKKASNGLKREEWMTELPQKMLKTGAYGLSTKTSFSRSSGGGCQGNAQSSSLWTSIPNGGQKDNTFDGPSTSSSNFPKPPSSKRSEQDEWAEKRNAELNKERNESLLDIHHKKRKLESNKNGNGEESSSVNKNSERRPFNRDTDLEIRGGSNKKSSSSDPSALKERVGDLSSRFGNNSDKKFL